MKDRWGIDFLEGSFDQKAFDAGLDAVHFFEDAIRLEEREETALKTGNW